MNKESRKIPKLTEIANNPELAIPKKIKFKISFSMIVFILFVLFFTFFLFNCRPGKIFGNKDSDPLEYFNVSN